MAGKKKMKTFHVSGTPDQELLYDEAGEIIWRVREFLKWARDGDICEIRMEAMSRRKFRSIPEYK